MFNPDSCHRANVQRSASCSNLGSPCKPRSRQEGFCWIGTFLMRECEATMCQEHFRHVTLQNIWTYGEKEQPVTERLFLILQVVYFQLSVVAPRETCTVHIFHNMVLKSYILHCTEADYIYSSYISCFANTVPLQDIKPANCNFLLDQHHRLMRWSVIPFAPVPQQGQKFSPS